MRPPYYLFYYRDQAAADQTQEAVDATPGRFGLVACSIILVGLIAVAFLSGF